MQLFFENILQFSYPPPPTPPYTKLKLGDNSGNTSNLVYGVGEGWACVI